LRSRRYASEGTFRLSGEDGQPVATATMSSSFGAGPTTLWALLNSLQMGFRTLALQQRSSEVWGVLGAVKTEFGKFGGVLEKVQKKLHAATREMDQAGVRTRAIERRLRDVQELPPAESQRLIPIDGLVVSGATGEGFEIEQVA
jgi:DNA recombination protein RmuC